MNLTKFSLDHSRLSVLFIFIVLGYGSYTLIGYPSQEDPQVLIREAVVTASFPGLATTRVENLITRKIEEKIRGIPEVESIRSHSKPGVSVIHVRLYDRFFDLEPIWQDLRNKMDDVRGELPDGTRGPFVNDDFGNVTIASIALTADGFSLEEMRQKAKLLRTDLYDLPGIKRIELFGIQEERIFLEFKDAQLAKYELSPAQIIQTLREQNVILPGGIVEIQGENLLIEPSGSFETLEDIGRVIIDIPTRRQVAYLRDIVKLRRAYVDPPSKPVFFNGKPTIILAVSMLSGSNLIELGQQLKVAVQKFADRLPIGYQLEFATFQPTLVDTSVTDFINNLYLTLAVVLFVVLVFLGVRQGLIVGAIIPMTMLLALIFMKQFAIPLHFVSIASMIIALGLLVDNGIVVTEDIAVRINLGQEPRQAALDTGQTLAVPLLTSSLTTILAFMPLMLAQNVTGEYTRSLSQVIFIVLLCSWFLAVYITPLLCYWFIGSKTDQPAVQPADDMQAVRLVLITPDGTSEVPLGDKDSVDIGRQSKNDVVLNFPGVSRCHAVIERDGAEFVIRDQESTNGTWLGDRRIEVHTLRNGDTIRIAGVQLMFKRGERELTEAASKSQEVDLYAGGFYRFYRALLTFVLRHRLLFLACNLGLLVAGAGLFKLIPQQFMPPAERDQFLVYLYLANGSSARETESVVRRFSEWLNDREINPEIVSHVAYVGGGGPRFLLSLAPIDPDPHVAFVLVDHESGADQAALIRRTRGALLAQFPQVRAEVKKISRGTTEEGLVDVRVSGSDMAILDQAAETLKHGFRSIPGTSIIKDDWGNKVRKIVVDVDQVRARRTGITSEEIAKSLSTILSGGEITDLREGDQSIPIVVRVEEAERINLDRLRTVNVYSASSDRNVPLIQVADFQLAWQNGDIVRRDLKRTITVSGKNEIMFAADLLAAIRPVVDRLNLPPGYQIEIGGEVESSREARSALFQFMPICILGIFALLVWQFNSFRRVLIIFVTIPLAIVGGIIGLWAMGAVYGFMAVLGFLSLAGIIINNAIVLIDRIDLEQAAGMTTDAAIVQAAVQRMRPILMTTLTTIAGLIPLMLFGGDFWFGMAVAIAFGLGLGTVMTLGVVPALYAVFFRARLPAR